MVKEEENSTSKNGTSHNKRVSFTCVGKETKFIIKLFNNTNANISYTATNTIENPLAFKQQECVDKYSGNGIHTLKCPDFGQRYVGQIERSFTTRCKEHLQSYKHQHQNSKFSQHFKASSFFGVRR
jgi:hypothetical protein